MNDPTAGAIRVRSGPKPFGPARQSFEITNGSRREVTVWLELSGSRCFTIPQSSRPLTLKPGRSVRAHVEFAPTEHGRAMTLSAMHRAAIKIWLRGQKEGMKDALVDVVRVTGIGPGVSSADVRCFDPEGAPRPQKSGRM
jgi:hypothetical protein